MGAASETNEFSFTFTLRQVTDHSHNGVMVNKLGPSDKICGTRLMVNLLIKSWGGNE